RRSSDLANVDVTVVRITNKAMSTALQLAVEFIEHEVTQQWRKRSSLRSSFHAGADQSVLHHPGIEECPDELQQPLVLDALGDLAHQFVVIDSIKELFQIEIDHPSVTLRDVLLRLSHSVMRRSTRSKPVAVLGERRVPSLLQHLHHRLLDEAIQRGGDAKLSHPSIRLRDFHPPHRFRFVGPVQQLLPNGRPVLLQIVAELIDRHPVDARATFVALHLPQCFLQVCSFTYLLQDSTRVGWAFGLTHHRERFDVFPPRLPGFTRRRRWEVQSRLDIQPLVAFEIHVLLASPLVRAFSHRFRFGLSVDSTFRRRSASLALPTTWPTMPSATSALRSDRLTAPSVAEATQSRSPGVSSVAFRASSPGLRFASLMDMDFAVSGPLVRRPRLLPDVCPSTRTFAVRFLQTSPRSDSPCVVANPSHPSGWVEDFHLQATEHAQHTTKSLRDNPRRRTACLRAWQTEWRS